MKLAIKKLGYSRSPWRLVDLTDEERQMLYNNLLEQSEDIG